MTTQSATSDDTRCDRSADRVAESASPSDVAVSSPGPGVSRAYGVTTGGTARVANCPIIITMMTTISPPEPITKAYPGI